MIITLSDLEQKLLKQSNPCKLVLAAGEDVYALEAIADAYQKAYIKPIVVGDENKIRALAKTKHIDLKGIEIISMPDQLGAVEAAVKMVHQGDAQILMKGASSTSVLLKAVLNKEWGLRKGTLLSHISIFEIPKYHKLLALTDVAINIAPDLDAKKAILENAVSFINTIGIKIPKVAIIAAVEKVYESMPATIEAAQLVEMASRGLIKDCILDGPLALDNAVDLESAKHKGIDSPVAGDADLLLLPQIETGNVLYKALSFLMDSKLAAVVLGAAAPIVLTSRADSHESKLNSIMLAAVSKLDA